VLTACEWINLYASPTQSLMKLSLNDFRRGVGTPSPSDCQASLQKALVRNDLRVTEVLRQPTRIYGHDLGDMIAFAFINKLPMIDQNLTRQIAYVSERLQENPDAFDLRVHVNGPRARMFSVAQPQLFLAVEKF
jgi:hypothetical protein